MLPGSYAFGQSPWAEATPAPVPSSSKQQIKSPKRRKRQPIAPRQTADPAAVEQALQQCQIYSGNDIISCFPTSNTTIPQHEYANFIWNARRPEITNTGNLVDIYLIHGDSLKPILEWRNTQNPFGSSGRLAAQVNDTWFGSRGYGWDGKNISQTYCWVLLPAGDPLDADATPQSTFTAVQTTYLDSVASSISSASASAASASSASAASASLASALSAASLSSALAANPSGSGQTGSGGGNDGNPPDGVQTNANYSSFPRWAIAVITVLGFLFLLAAAILAFLLMRRARRRNENRDSTASSSAPIMQEHHADSPQSPLLGGAAAGAMAGGARTSSLAGQNTDAASVQSGATGEAGPFSGADAAIMADAFRKALRKPEFAEGTTPEEGDSPGQVDEAELINKELAEEGRDLRKVSSSREVNVQNPSES